MFAALKAIFRVKKAQEQTARIQAKMADCTAIITEIKASRLASDIAIGAMRADTGRYINAMVRDHNETRANHLAESAAFIADINAMRRRYNLA